MKQVLVLYSGGADSVYLLMLAHRMKHKVTPVALLYGQKHAEELRYAKELLSKLPGYASSMLLEVNIQGCFRNSRSNLLKDSVSVSYEGVHEMHVPARNGIFIMTALSLAETYGLDEVWIGCDYSDRLNQFPDCFQEWIVKMDQIAQVNGSRPIRVKAPLLGLEKSDVVTLLAAEGVTLEDVYSGYNAPKASRPTDSETK